MWWSSYSLCLVHSIFKGENPIYTISLKKYTISLHLDIYRLISFKFGMMIKTTKLYISISVSIILIFIQGHNCIRNKKIWGRYHVERLTVRRAMIRRPAIKSSDGRLSSSDCRLPMSDWQSGNMWVDMSPAVSRLARYSKLLGRGVGMGGCQHPVLSKVLEPVSSFFICN